MTSLLNDDAELAAEAARLDALAKVPDCALPCYFGRIGPAVDFAGGPGYKAWVSLYAIVLISATFHIQTVTIGELRQHIHADDANRIAGLRDDDTIMAVVIS